MNKIITKDYEKMSLKCADLITDYIKKNPDALISFPGGNTPMLTVDIITERINNKEIDISNIKFVSLDEWVGLSKDDEGSCGEFIDKHLISAIKYPFKDVFILNGKSKNLVEECKKHEDFIKKYGPIGLSVLGIGMNGHIGFNEEIIDENVRSHIHELSDTTLNIMSKYFNAHPTKGITQGVGQIMEASEIIVMANGEAKAEIIKKSIVDETSKDVSASWLQKHSNCYFVIDEDAAKLI